MLSATTYLAYVTTELLMITCSVAIRLLLTNVLMHVKMQPIITGTTISNFFTTTYRTSDGFDLAPKIQQYIPSCGTKSDEQLSVGQSEAADLEVTMVPAWVLQQTGTMITLGSPAAVRSQYHSTKPGTPDT